MLFQSKRSLQLDTCMLSYSLGNQKVSHRVWLPQTKVVYRTLSNCCWREGRKRRALMWPKKNPKMISLLWTCGGRFQGVLAKLPKWAQRNEIRTEETSAGVENDCVSSCRFRNRSRKQILAGGGVFVHQHHCPDVREPGMGSAKF